MRAGCMPMMKLLANPRKLIFVGLALMLIGWFIPLFTVLDMITPSLLLLFGSYAAALAGFVLGLIGVFTHFPRPGR